jgi:hypothetical protein
MGPGATQGKHGGVSAAVRNLPERINPYTFGLDFPIE